MKRQPAYVLPSQCESCFDFEPKPGDFVTFEGFLVCGVCRREQAVKLSARRRKVDEKTLATLGEVIAAKGQAMKRRATILPPAPDGPKLRRRRFLPTPEPMAIVIAADESCASGKSWEAPPAERMASDTETVKPRKR